MAISTAPQLADFSAPQVSPSTPLPIKQETMLTRYFRDVAPLPVLKPQQELPVGNAGSENVFCRSRGIWIAALNFWCRLKTRLAVIS